MFILPQKFYKLIKIWGKIKYILIAIITTVTLTGCTVTSSQIVNSVEPSPSTSFKYEGISCERLASEYQNIDKREKALTESEIQAIDDNTIDADFSESVLIGYAVSPGAKKLASLRGERADIKATMTKRGCNNS